MVFRNWRVGPKTLPPAFEPNNYTVISGKGKFYYDFVGNRRFRLMVQMRLDRYDEAETKSEKSKIVSEVVKAVRSSGGHFARYDETNCQWHEVGDRLAREKTSGLFREYLYTKYRSSSKSKIARKKEISMRMSSTSSYSNVNVSSYSHARNERSTEDDDESTAIVAKHSIFQCTEDDCSSDHEDGCCEDELADKDCRELIQSFAVL